VIDPQTPSTIYAGTSYSGLFKSTNGGGNWNAINVGLDQFDQYIRALVIDPKTPTTLYTGTYTGIFKSSNSGQSWSAFSLGFTDMDIWSIAIDPKTPTTLYAGTGGSGVFKNYIEYRLSLPIVVKIH
jgi:ligand-binding sensor domain-containing protein